MAGIGEVCSHIAAVPRLSKTFLVRHCHAIGYPSFRTVEFLTVSKIDFRTPHQKRKLSLVDNADASSVMPAPKVRHVLKPTEAQLSDYYL